MGWGLTFAILVVIVGGMNEGEDVTIHDLSSGQVESGAAHKQVQGGKRGHTQEMLALEGQAKVKHAKARAEKRITQLKLVTEFPPSQSDIAETQGAAKKVQRTAQGVSEATRATLRSMHKDAMAKAKAIHQELAQAMPEMTKAQEITLHTQQKLAVAQMKMGVLKLKGELAAAEAEGSARDRILKQQALDAGHEVASVIFSSHNHTAKEYGTSHEIAMKHNAKEQAARAAEDAAKLNEMFMMDKTDVEELKSSLARAEAFAGMNQKLLAKAKQQVAESTRTAALAKKIAAEKKALALDEMLQAASNLKMMSEAHTKKLNEAEADANGVAKAEKNEEALSSELKAEEGAVEAEQEKLAARTQALQSQSAAQEAALQGLHKEEVKEEAMEKDLREKARHEAMATSFSAQAIAREKAAEKSATAASEKLNAEKIAEEKASKAAGEGKNTLIGADQQWAQAREKLKSSEQTVMAKAGGKVNLSGNAGQAFIQVKKAAEAAKDKDAKAEDKVALAMSQAEASEKSLSATAKKEEDKVAQSEEKASAAALSLRAAKGKSGELKFKSQQASKAADLAAKAAQIVDAAVSKAHMQVLATGTKARVAASTTAATLQELAHANIDKVQIQSALTDATEQMATSKSKLSDGKQKLKEAREIEAKARHKAEQFYETESQDDRTRRNVISKLAFARFAVHKAEQRVKDTLATVKVVTEKTSSLHTQLTENGAFYEKLHEKTKLQLSNNATIAEAHDEAIRKQESVREAGAGKLEEETLAVKAAQRAQFEFQQAVSEEKESSHLTEEAKQAAFAEQKRLEKEEKQVKAKAKAVQQEKLRLKAIKRKKHELLLQGIHLDEIKKEFEAAKAAKMMAENTLKRLDASEAKTAQELADSKKQKEAADRKVAQGTAFATRAENVQAKLKSVKDDEASAIQSAERKRANEQKRAAKLQEQSQEARGQVASTIKEGRKTLASELKIKAESERGAKSISAVKEKALFAFKKAEGANPQLSDARAGYMHAKRAVDELVQAEKIKAVEVEAGVESAKNEVGVAEAQLHAARMHKDLIVTRLKRKLAAIDEAVQAVGKRHAEIAEVQRADRNETAATRKRVARLESERLVKLQMEAKEALNAAQRYSQEVDSARPKAILAAETANVKTKDAAWAAFHTDAANAKVHSAAAEEEANLTTVEQRALQAEREQKQQEAESAALQKQAAAENVKVQQRLAANAKELESAAKVMQEVMVTAPNLNITGAQELGESMEDPVDVAGGGHAALVRELKRASLELDVHDEKAAKESASQLSKQVDRETEDIQNFMYQTMEAKW